MLRTRRRYAKRLYSADCIGRTRNSADVELIPYKWALVIEEVEEVCFCILIHGKVEESGCLMGVWKSRACRIGIILMAWQGDWVGIL